MQVSRRSPVDPIDRFKVKVCQTWLHSIYVLPSESTKPYVPPSNWRCQVVRCVWNPNTSKNNQISSSERVSERGGEERIQSIEGLDITGLRWPVYMYIYTCMCVCRPLLGTEFRVGHEDTGHGFGASTDEQYYGSPERKGSKFAASSQWLIQEVEVYYFGRLSTSPAVTTFHWISFSPTLTNTNVRLASGLSTRMFIKLGRWPDFIASREPGRLRNVRTI